MGRRRDMSRQFHIVVKRGGIDPPARQFLDRQRNPKRRAVKPFDFVHLTFGKADALAHFQQEESAQPDPLANEYRDDDKVFEHEDNIPASTLSHPGLAGYPPPGFIPTLPPKR